MTMQLKSRLPVEGVPESLLPDATQTWVDRYCPARLQPYLKLMRLERPIGIWLLLWPSWWGLTLASGGLPSWQLLAIFFAGAVLMRGAGCTINDIADRKLDQRVARTARRPLAAGDVSLHHAIAFLGLQLLAALFLLMQLNTFTIWLGVASVLPVMVYPLMKRWTWWPQAWLAFTFNWGLLMGWSAVTGELSLPPIILYLGCAAWMIGYDTIYALQDKTDDQLVGIKSTALYFGARAKAWVAAFYGLFFVSLLATCWLLGLGWMAWGAVLFTGTHLLWQIKKTHPDLENKALPVFLSNRWIGLAVWLGFLIDLEKAFLITLL